MWLLEPSFARELRAKIKMAGQPSADQLARFEAHKMGELARVAAADGQPPNLKVAGDVAEIGIKGVLVAKFDFILWLFDIEQTSYDQVNAALATASADPTVKRVVLNIDSPGGQVKGLFDTLATLDAYSKPKSVRASLAASAAYGIAALGGKIEATNPAATFGSVGVVATYLIDEELVEVTNTESPDKRPDPTTDEGKSVIREYLDALYQLFIELIAKGRGITVDEVNANFGRGAVFVAADAKKRGMIDKAPPKLRAVKAATDPAPVAGDDQGREQLSSAPQDSGPEPQNSAANIAAHTGARKMDLQTLKAQHPDVYAAAFDEGKKQGTEAGHAAGVSAERDRVSAHLIRGKASGAIDLAIQSVESGAEMTETLKAKYDTAAQNRRDQTERQEETDEAAKAVDGGVSAAGAKKEGAKSLVARTADALGF